MQLKFTLLFLDFLESLLSFLVNQVSFVDPLLFHVLELLLGKILSLESLRKLLLKTIEVLTHLLIYVQLRPLHFLIDGADLAE